MIERVLPSEAPIAKHLLPLTAARDPAGRLRIGGVDLLDLAEDLGTPVFVYDEEHLRVRCREALAAFGHGVAYATKAFLCKAMAALAHEEGLLLDVASGGETTMVLAAGVPPERLVLHGSNKSEDELETAITAGLGRIVVDSFDEIERLDRLVSRHGRWGGAQGEPQQVLVRVTPGVEAHTHEYVMTGQDDSKFGFSLESGAAAEAVKKLRAIRNWKSPAFTRTSGARSSGPTRSPARRLPWRLSSPRRASGSCASAGVSGLPTSTTRWHRRWSIGRPPSARRVRPPASRRG